MSEHPISFSDTNNDQNISVFCNDREVLRLSRISSWRLQRVSFGMPVKDDVVAKSKYRSELIHAIESGAYDDVIAIIMSNGEDG